MITPTDHDLTATRALAADWLARGKDLEPTGYNRHLGEGEALMAELLRRFDRQEGWQLADKIATGDPSMPLPSAGHHGAAAVVAPSPAHTRQTTLTAEGSVTRRAVTHPGPTDPPSGAWVKNADPRPIRPVPGR